MKYRLLTVEDTTAWKRSCEDQAQHRRAAISVFLSEYLLPADTRLVGDDNLLLGLLWEQDPLPQGWRRHRVRAGVITPDTDTPAGQEIARALAALPHANHLLLLPGRMPPSLTTERGHTVVPATAEHEDRLTVTWPQPLPGEVRDRLDHHLWQAAA